MGFVWRKIIKMADKMAPTYQYLLLWSLLLSHFNWISSKFHIWIASINLSFKYEYGFCQTSDNQDGQQNGRRLSMHVCCRGHSNLVIFYQISSKFHVWIASIKLLFKF